MKLFKVHGIIVEANDESEAIGKARDQLSIKDFKGVAEVIAPSDEEAAAFRLQQEELALAASMEAEEMLSEKGSVDDV